MNPYLLKDDLYTAKLYENAYITDIGNKIACTDGDKVYLNTPENLTKLVPEYSEDFQKLLLLHEEEHKILGHHPRYRMLLDKYERGEMDSNFKLNMNEVNIVMDILVHDIILDKYPELLETAKKNLAQLRNRNSLKFTFKGNTLESMIDEYNKFKKGEAEDGDTEDKERSSKDKDSKDKETKGTKSKDKDDKSKDSKDKDSKDKDSKDKDSKETKSKTETKSSSSEPEHKEMIEQENVDWSELEKRDEKEFISEWDSACIQRNIERLRRRKKRLTNMTKKLNSMVTSQRVRTYRRPSYIQVKDAVLKGSLPGSMKLALVFDASGSMDTMLSLFKEIIQGAIPQAMTCPTSWFAGGCAEIEPYDKSDVQGYYYEGTFKDIIPVYATRGYGDDGDRVLELAYQYEQKGYAVIGVTDGGGGIYEKGRDVIKKLKRTTIVTQSSYYEQRLKENNHNIEVIYVEED